MNSGPERIQHATAHALHGVAGTRQVELASRANLPAHTLMQRAGLSVAKLAMALAPHARTVWVACGSGNNGGDGLEAATHLKRWGKTVVVTWLGNRASAPADAQLSCRRAVNAGLEFATEPPAHFDLCIDALLGIGSPSAGSGPREFEGRMAQWIKLMNTASAPVLAVDLPTGLHSDTGQIGLLCVRANFSLSLLTLKPGLFTAHGRDASGEIWLDTLGVGPNINAVPPTAWLSGKPAHYARTHASHKGSFGDVAVVGGAPGMTGAALLAAGAALHFGAGRVFVELLDEGAMLVDPNQPELMFRSIDTLDIKRMTVVCGCGGADAVRQPLARILSLAALAVIDADAINAIAKDAQLQTLLRTRARRGLQTVLTPHPLEAARLLGASTTQVQQDRLAAAQQLAGRFDCVVALKGSGTVIAAPAQTPTINPTGNARLATAGTGDVLAGMVGARLANGMARGDSAFQATCDAVHLHGLCADNWPEHRHLTAGDMVKML